MAMDHTRTIDVIIRCDTGYFCKSDIFAGLFGDLEFAADMSDWDRGGNSVVFRANDEATLDTIQTRAEANNAQYQAGP